ncbi:hypothetical protein V6N13_046929 [Hibiscus sabdariffa]|uniref:Uncharacterized protein n=2 Tax=Hibiscus sabdariffa TaxID=183260 RepID=A0ABR2ADF7_9ROSI
MLRVFPDITVSPTALPSSIGVDTSRPDVDPPDLGRIVDPLTDATSEMDASDPVQTDKQPSVASPSLPSYKDTLSPPTGRMWLISSTMMNFSP